MIKTRKNYLRTFLNIIFISSLVLTGCSEISSKFNSSDSKREINSTEGQNKLKNIPIGRFGKISEI